MGAPLRGRARRRQWRAASGVLGRGAAVELEEERRVEREGDGASSRCKWGADGFCRGSAGGGALDGGNGGGCGSRAREQRLASAFIGSMVKEEWISWAGRPGSSGSGRGARPDAAVAERPSRAAVVMRRARRSRAQRRCRRWWQQ